MSVCLSKKIEGSKQAPARARISKGPIGPLNSSILKLSILEGVVGKVGCDLGKFHGQMSK